MVAPASPWTAPVRLDDIPPEGREVVLVADAPVRDLVAREAGLVGIPRLDARFTLQRRGHEAVHVEGDVIATIEQTCGITLEPLTNEVNEHVDLVFSAAAVRASEPPDVDVPVGSSSNDTPEPLVGGAVDLGALAVEFLLLGIDPFPRKPGVEFSRPPEDAAGSSPFAVLAKLKDRGEGEG